MLQENYAIVTEEDLLRKVSDTENNFVERKTISDTRGWLETAVAFANLCPIGQPGILYIGANSAESAESATCALHGNWNLWISGLFFWGVF